MMIQVRAIMPEGYDGAFRAGRKWPAGQPVAVEVLDQDEDPPQIEVDHIIDGVKRGTRKIHDPYRIGRNSYKELKADGRISLLADKESAGELGGEALAAARSMYATTASENAKLKVRVAELEEENRSLRGRAGDQRVVAAATPAAPVAEPAEHAPAGDDDEHRRKPHRR